MLSIFTPALVGQVEVLGVLNRKADAKSKLRIGYVVYDLKKDTSIAVDASVSHPMVRRFQRREDRGSVRITRKRSEATHGSSRAVLRK